jgi:hypothetical protein
MADCSGNHGTKVLSFNFKEALLSSPPSPHGPLGTQKSITATVEYSIAPQQRPKLWSIVVCPIPVRSPSPPPAQAGHTTSISMKASGSSRSGTAEDAGNDLHSGWQLAQRNIWKRKEATNGQGRQPRQPVRERLSLPGGTPAHQNDFSHQGVGN